MAFGIVAVIRSLLAALALWGGVPANHFQKSTRVVVQTPPSPEW